MVQLQAPKQWQWTNLVIGLSPFGEYRLKYLHFILFFTVMLAKGCANVESSQKQGVSSLSDLKNYQVNSAQMVSAGLPTEAHFRTLKAMGVTRVIDLIPGDRSEESQLMSKLDLSYSNIAVEWQNPTIENFRDYVTAMQVSSDTNSANEQGITLTHCRLNWRGAVFTYLYRVTQLNEPEEIAKKDMLAIWEPNATWQTFIDQVLEVSPPNQR